MIYALIMRERGTGRCLRKSVEAKAAPGIGDEVDLCPRLSFGRRRVSFKDVGPNKEVQVHFEEFDPNVFAKFLEYLQDDSDWQFLA